MLPNAGLIADILCKSDTADTEEISCPRDSSLLGFPSYVYTVRGKIMIKIFK